MSTVTAPPSRELTPDDVLAMSGDVLYELVDGRLVEVNVSTISSRVAGTVTKLLTNHCDSPLIAHVFPEHGYTCFPGKRNRMRRPDVSFSSSHDACPLEMFAEGFTSIPPDLAIEVDLPERHRPRPRRQARRLSARRSPWSGSSSRRPEGPRHPSGRDPAGSRTRRRIDRRGYSPRLPLPRGRPLHGCQLTRTPDSGRA